MKNTIDLRIKALRGLIERRVEPAIITSEVDAIFKMIRDCKDKEVINGAIDQLLELTVGLTKEINLDGLLSMLLVTELLGKGSPYKERKPEVNKEQKEESKSKVKNIVVKVDEFIDAIVIKPDILADLDEMKLILEKVIPNVTKDWEHSIYEDDKLILKRKAGKILVLDISNCTECKKIKEMYINNFITYIKR